MGLGNSRRGMKSPPLMVAVLLACVFVLGINYWITSSRCVELQSRVVDLEGRMRRAAAERGAVELKKNEFEENLKKQMDQLENIQSMHGSQMKIFHSEKAFLIQNITNKDSIIRNLQGQLNSFQLKLEQQKESQALKSTFELAQCSNKMKELNEQCEEKLRKATGKDSEKKDVVITPDKLKHDEPKISVPIVTPKQDLNHKDTVDGNEIQEVEGKAAPNISKLTVNSQKEIPVIKAKVEEETNEVKEKVIENEKKKPSAPNQAEANKAEEPGNPPDVDAANKEDQEQKAEDIDDKGTEKELENEEVEREHLLGLEGQQEDKESDKDTNPGEQEEDQENQNDYNGDEGNEAEPEADKQAQLIDNDQNLKDEKLPKIGNAPSFNQEAEDNDDSILKK